MMWAGAPACATVTQADAQLTRRCGIICTGPGVAVLSPLPSTGFQPASAAEIKGDFADSKIPGGLRALWHQNIGGVLFVTYAKQDAAQHDDVAGQGNGFVDMFDTEGHLLKRFVTRGN
jgi:hypothetical protein